jgi:hypothetical protein
MLWQLQWVQRACGSAWRLHTKHLTTLARPHHQGHLEGDVRHTAAAAFCLGAACSPTAVTFVAAAVKPSSGLGLGLGHLEGDVRHTAAAAFCLGAACSPTAVTFVAAAVKRSFSCNSNSLKRKKKQETKTRVKTQV